MQALAAPHACVVQAERLGTAHAALAAGRAVRHRRGRRAVCRQSADPPRHVARPAGAPRRRRCRAGAAGDASRRPRSLRPRDRRAASMSSASSNGPMPPTPSGPRTLCNAGVLCAAAADMARWLRVVRPDNAKGEYYLTDLVALARGDGARVAAVLAPYGEAARHQLARRAGRGRGDGAVLAARRGAGRRRDDDRPRLGVPGRRHGLGERRDDRAERGVRPGGARGVGDGDPRIQPSGRLHHRAGLHHRPARADPSRQRAGGGTCMSATSSS